MMATPQLRNVARRNIKWAVECEMPSGQCSLAELELDMLGHGKSNWRRVRSKQIRRQPALYYLKWRVVRALEMRRGCVLAESTLSECCELRAYGLRERNFGK